MRTLLAAVVFLTFPAFACEPLATVGVGYSDNYVSYGKKMSGYYTDKLYKAGYVEGNNYLGRVKLGFSCYKFDVFVEHTSSLNTNRDTGYEAIFVEFNFFK